MRKRRKFLFKSPFLAVKRSEKAKTGCTFSQWCSCIEVEESENATIFE
jgi:hypothetical protein